MRKRDSDISALLFKRSGKEKIIFVMAFILFILYTITMVAPFIWLFISSLKGGLEYRMDSALGQAFSWPEKLLFTNYMDAFRELEYDGNGLFDMLFNSVWYTLVVTVEGVFFSACTGYCLSKYEFKLKNLLYGIAIFSMTIPIVGTLGASFKLSADLGIYDTPLQPILSCAGGFGFNFLIMYSFFKSMPWSYDENILRLEEFYTAYEKQWMWENKPHGFDIIDIRLGGLLKRFEHAKQRILQYAKGEIERIEELEEPVLEVNNWVFSEMNKTTFYNSWVQSATCNVITHPTY